MLTFLLVLNFWFLTACFIIWAVVKFYRWFGKFLDRQYYRTHLRKRIW